MHTLLRGSTRAIELGAVGGIKRQAGSRSWPVPHPLQFPHQRTTYNITLQIITQNINAFTINLQSNHLNEIISNSLLLTILIMHPFTAFLALTVNSVIALPQGSESILVPAHPFRPHELLRRAISPEEVLKNGQLAQSLNAKYASLTTDTPCQVGDKACIQGGFAQCVAGKYVVTGCAPPTVCFELRKSSL